MARAVQLSTSLDRALLLCMALGASSCMPAADSHDSEYASAPALDCAVNVADPALAGRAKQIRREFEAGETLRAVRTMFGEPRECLVSARDGIVESSYRLGGGATLQARFDPRIGYAAYRIDGLRVEHTASIRLAKAMEHDQVGSQGCDMHWDSPGASEQLSARLRRDSFSGDVCNCRAIVDVSGNRVESVAFSSAC